MNTYIARRCVWWDPRRRCALLCLQQFELEGKHISRVSSDLAQTCCAVGIKPSAVGSNNLPGCRKNGVSLKGDYLEEEFGCYDIALWIELSTFLPVSKTKQ
jgi:hypothetical protein